LFVGGSSATEKPHSCFVIARLGSWHSGSNSHNREGFEEALPAAEEATKEVGQALGLLQARRSKKP
jgi:hypothetical protein